MIKIHTVEGDLLINSVELYDSFGLTKDHYTRWYKVNILITGKEGTDFFDKDKDLFRYPISAINKGRPKKEFYVSLQFAHGLCMVAKTAKSKKVRLWLLSILKQK